MIGVSPGLLRGGRKAIVWPADGFGPGASLATAVPIRYRVMDGETERMIEYRPEGRERVTIQELTPDARLSARGCRALQARMSGC